MDDIILEALERRASDIHIEPTKTELRIRYRVDGVLHDHTTFPFFYAAQIISRIKIAAHINISQKRVPQDGKFSCDYKGSHIDIRVSTFPAQYGEHVVMRLLQRNDQIMALDALGMSKHVYEPFLDCISRASGFFLVTGPTGAGKTTTLYATLMHLNTPEKHIITLEDPIEYTISGITQGNINPETGFTFERGVRALLRQDPDIAILGEMRDRQTARIAIEASLAGHLVASTLHTRSAPGALMRLLDMGIEPFLVNAAVTCVLAQRLARKICQHCKEDVAPNETEKRMLEKFNVVCDSLYIGQGCDACFGLGYIGRVALFELLVMSERMRGLLMQHPAPDVLCAQAVEDGMKPLLHDGLEKVKEGIVSLSELMRTAS